jgi:RimJ/RimL family protein N-acetyltransferase
METTQIDIATNRLHLTSGYRAAPEHVKWLNDKELMKWSEQRYREHDYETQRDFLAVALMVGNPLVWDIRAGIDSGQTWESGLWKPIGTIHAYIDERHKRVDMGILIGPEYHGKGYAAEAWSSVYNYLGARHGFRKFEAGTVDGNTPMIKLLMRAGWTPECRRENHFIIDGEPRALVQFGKVFS